MTKIFRQNTIFFRFWNPINIKTNVVQSKWDEERFVSWLVSTIWRFNLKKTKSKSKLFFSLLLWFVDQLNEVFQRVQVDRRSINKVFLRKSFRRVAFSTFILSICDVSFRFKEKHSKVSDDKLLCSFFSTSIDIRMSDDDGTLIS